MVNIPSEPSGRSPKEKKEEGSEKMTEPFEFSLDKRVNDGIIEVYNLRCCESNQQTEAR